MPSTSNGREQRRLTLDDVHVRSNTAGDEVKVRGHAAVWDKPAWIGPPKYGFTERFEAGAFRESINGGADVRYLFNHNPDAVLARTKSGTLRLGEDATGMTVEADLAPTSIGRDLAILMERGDVNQMSVGMQVLEDRWDEAPGKDGQLYERRTIVRAKLFDVSAVTYPAYEETDAGLRDADIARELRDARGVHVARRPRPPAVNVPPDPPRAARIEVLPDGEMRIHRPDGTTVDVTGTVIGRSVAFDGSAQRSNPDVGTPGVATTAETADGHVVSTAGTSAPVHTVTEGATPAAAANQHAETAPPTPPPPAEDAPPATPANPATGGVLPSPGPATATSEQTELRRGYVLNESERSVFELIQEHAFTTVHRDAPRLKCPVCNRPATATGTPTARPQ